MTEENGQATLKLTENSLRYIEFPRTEDDDFDWMTDQAVVVSHSPGIAIYLNKEGSVVVRQYGMAAEDSFVIIRKEDAKRVAKAIVEATNGQA